MTCNNIFRAELNKKHYIITDTCVLFNVRVQEAFYFKEHVSLNINI